MVFPIALPFLALIFLLLFNIKRNHDDIRRRISFIQEKYLNEVLLEKSDISCESSTSGLKNGKYLFTKCDLIFLKNALVIISFRKIGKYKLYSNLFFIENNIVAGHGAIKRFNANSFNKDVHMEFGNPSFISTLVIIRLKQLTTNEKSLIQISEIG